MRGSRACRVRAQAQAQPSPLAIAIGGPVSVTGGSLPTSFRAITTDPVFQPATEGCNQYAPGPPQLVSRHITGNPVHGLVAWLEVQLAGIDRAFAVAMDDAPLAHAAAAAVTGLWTYLGLHPLTLVLRGGLSDSYVSWLEVQLGGWAVPVATAAALAVGLAAALWQLRTWVVAQLALVRADDALKGATEARAAAAAAAVAAAPEAATGEASSTGAASAPGAEGEAAATAAAAAATGGAFNQVLPSGVRDLFESDWKTTDKTWLYVIVAARLGTLLTAASSILAGATSRGAAYAALCFACSLVPAAVPHVRHLLAASAPYAARLAAPLLLADAAFLLALAPAAPLEARAAAAAALALGSGLAAAAAAASPRLASVRAAAGDVATFHLTVRLPLSGTLIDSTVGHRPLRAVVASGRAQDAGGAAAAQVPAVALTGAELTDPRVEGSTAGVVLDPQARFRPLQALAAAGLVEGMYVGQQRRVLVAVDTDGDGAADADADSGVVPYKNPGLVWWQSYDDLRRKVGASTLEWRPLEAGDVFWYPIGSLVSELGSTRLSTRAIASSVSAAAVAALPGADSWGPVQVTAVAGEWVQLDGNFGLAGGQAEVEVELIGLGKGGQAS